MGLFDAFPENIRTFGGGGKVWSKSEVIGLYLAIVTLGVIAAYLTQRPSDDALNAILTAVSIIAGFTFSTLIFLVDHKFVVQSDPDSLEQESFQRKIDRLADSSFNILFYFNVVALLVVASCICGLLLPSASGSFPATISRWFFLTEFIGRLVFFCLLIETGVTFTRLLRRLRFLFSKAREKRPST